MNCLACETETDDQSLCQPCTTQTDAQLRDLPSLYDALGAYLRPSSQVSVSLGSGGPAPDAPLPVLEAALDLRGPGGIVQALEEWRAALHADAGWHDPGPFGDYPGRLRRAVAGLRMKLPYIASSWSQAGQFVVAVRDLHSSARSIIAPRERTVRAGLCTTDVEGEVCGTVLRATPGVPEIRCAWCGTSYPPSSWMDLAGRQVAA